MRVVDQGAGDGDALLLAAGELQRPVVEPVAQADHARPGPMHRCRVPSFSGMPWYMSGSSMFSTTVYCGSRLYDWKMKPR